MSEHIPDDNTNRFIFENDWMPEYQCQMIETPEPSGWRCEMFGMKNHLVVFPYKGNVPNWFWRFMQWLAFGNRWIKEGKE